MVFKLSEGEQEAFFCSFGGALPLGTFSVAPEKSPKMQGFHGTDGKLQFHFKCLMI